MFEIIATTTLLINMISFYYIGRFRSLTLPGHMKLNTDIALSINFKSNTYIIRQQEYVLLGFKYKLLFLNHCRNRK